MTTTTTKTVLSIPQSAIAAGIRSTIHAVNSESVRFALAGVHVVVEGNAITFVATDGRRLAWRSFQIEAGQDPVSFTIPTKAAKELARMPRTKTAVVIVDESQVIVEWENRKRQDKQTTFTPLEGRFPKWRDVVNGARKEWNGELSGKADELLAHFAQETAIDILVNGSAVSYRHEQRIVSKSIKHEGEFDVCLTNEFLVDVLSACGESYVSIRVFDKHNPVWIDCDNGLQSVIMPRAAK